MSREGGLKNRAVFFDRDGVVNVSPGEGYVLRWEDFHLQEGIVEAIREARRQGCLAILVTSQRGVGKGLMTREELDRIHREMQSILSSEGAEFDAIYAFTGEPDCPHRAKPDPEMIESACVAYSIDPGGSWMIGDADRDIVMARAAGLGGTIRVQSEKSVGEPADHTVDTTIELGPLLGKLL